MGDQHATDVLKEIVALADDPSQTLEDVAGKLETMYRRAEDSQDDRGMQLVNTVYDGVLKLHEQVGTAVNVAVAAREIATELQKQRDAAIEEMKQVEEMNPDHPLVQEICEMAAEDYQEGLMNDGVYISYDPAYDITEEAQIPCSYDTASMFHNIITQYCGGDGLNEVPLEIRQEIADFMAMIVKKVMETPSPTLPRFAGQGEERTP
jgi:hypothetical protein